MTHHGCVLCSEILFQRQDVFAVLIGIGHVVHDLLGHEDAEAAHLPFRRGQAHVGILLCQRVIGDAVVHKGDGHGDGVFRNLHADDGLPLLGDIGIAGDIDENLLHRHADLHQSLRRAVRHRQPLFHKGLHHGEILCRGLHFQLMGVEKHRLLGVHLYYEVLDGHV